MDEEHVAGSHLADEIDHHICGSALVVEAAGESGAVHVEHEHPHGFVGARDAVVGLAVFPRGSVEPPRRAQSITLAFSSSSSSS